MMNKNTTALAYGVVLATIFAVLVTYVVYGAWPRLHIPLTLMMFIGLSRSLLRDSGYSTEDFRLAARNTAEEGGNFTNG